MLDHLGSQRAVVALDSRARSVTDTASVGAGCGSGFMVSFRVGLHGV